MAQSSYCGCTQKKALAESKPQDGPTPQCKGLCETYVFVRFPSELYQDLKNSLTKNMPIHKNYKGRVVGIAATVRVLDGKWPIGNGLAVLHFDTMVEAERWFVSAPDVKQQDWIKLYVDIVAVSCREFPVSGRNWMEVTEFVCNDANTVSQNMCSKLQSMKQSSGAQLGVVVSGNIYQFRGLWSPPNFMVSLYKGEQDISSTHASDGYKKLKQFLINDSQAVCNTVLVKLDPIS